MFQQCERTAAIEMTLSMWNLDHNSSSVMGERRDSMIHQDSLTSQPEQPRPRHNSIGSYLMTHRNSLPVNWDWSSPPDIADITQVSLSEFFFHAVPMVVNPIIILRVLCHKMFGHMLRRKTHLSNQNLTSAHSLSPPLVMPQDEACPPRPPSTEGEKKNSPTGSPPNGKKKKVHVQITTPTPTEVEQIEEALRKMRGSRRANSMDKSALRLSAIHRKNATMSLAIKAIADSLVTPLDLNLSPPPRITDLELDQKAKKNIFRFPSMKSKRISKSYGYLVSLGQSLDEEALTPQTQDSDSVTNLVKMGDRDIRELQRELINLPTYEVDTHRMDQSTSPLLSRSNSVPELLNAGTLAIGLEKSPTICQIPVVTTTWDETETTQAEPLLSLAANSSTEQEEEEDEVAQHFSNRQQRQSRHHRHALPPPDLNSDPSENIIVHFAAATPMESPASNVDEPLSPLLPGMIIIKICKLK